MAIVKIEDLPIMYAKLCAADIDLGPQDGSDLAIKIDSRQGQYTVNLMLTADKKQELIDAGVTDKGMVGQNYKQDKNGLMYYYAKRGHFNPYFTDQNTGKKGVVVGPPKVFHMVDGEAIEWDWDVMGKIGNNSTVTAKFNVYKPKNIAELVAILVTDHVEYEGAANDGSW
jgi:hypothetical protein